MTTPNMLQDSNDADVAMPAGRTVGRLLRLCAVKDRTGLGTSTIYAARARGEFPDPVRIGPRAVAWKETDIEMWIQARCAAATK